MNTVIFDLDGTLLPMNQELFIEEYFKALAKKASDYGFHTEALIKGVWTGTEAMIRNDGSMTNEQRFWNIFSELFGEEVREMEPVFEEFYQNEFQIAKQHTTPTVMANQCIQLLRSKGYQVVLATNPVFPRVATHKRMGWAGLNTEDFIWITTYENSSFCKPNLAYYKEILQSINRKPSECIMVGNDVREDMCVDELGMDTFLLTDCLINTLGTDSSSLKQGNFEALFAYIKGLPSLL